MLKHTMIAIVKKEELIFLLGAERGRESVRSRGGQTCLCVL